MLFLNTIGCIVICGWLLFLIVLIESLCIVYFGIVIEDYFFISNKYFGLISQEKFLHQENPI
jgi:purine-cytosine permease-like protein